MLKVKKSGKKRKVEEEEEPVTNGVSSPKKKIKQVKEGKPAKDNKDVEVNDGKKTKKTKKEAAGKKTTTKKSNVKAEAQLEEGSENHESVEADLGSSKQDATQFEEELPQDVEISEAEREGAFENFNISEEIVSRLKGRSIYSIIALGIVLSATLYFTAKGVTYLFPIQAQTYKIIMGGFDCIGRARKLFSISKANFSKMSFSFFIRNWYWQDRKHSLPRKILNHIDNYFLVCFCHSIGGNAQYQGIFFSWCPKGG
jgi:ATP-dependent RNA helicase DDX21